MAALSIRVGTARPETARGFRLGLGARIAVLSLAGLYFLVPLAAAARFALEGPHGSLTFAAFGQVFTDPALWPALSTSLEVAAGAVVITLALLVPTAILVSLRLPRLRSVMESLTLLPIVIPAVVLVLGIFDAFSFLPSWITATPVILALEYVVLALPYSYRAIDSGVQAIDLRTLVDASRSLGAGWRQTLARVVLPNIASAVLGAAFLTVAFCLGEFAVANLLTMNTFPTWLYEVGTEQPAEAVALSVLALVLTWVVLLALSVLGARRRAASRALAPKLDGRTPAEEKEVR